MVTMGGLFSGVGGFELAGLHANILPLWSNDIDPWCVRNMRKNFSHNIIEKSIKDLKDEELETVDIICGGDPCQPHSVAGLGKGKADDRYLWPEMFRIIRAKKPSFVLNENVDGTIANGVLDGKINDLESQGYTCQAYCVPAESVGALHKRNRIWLVAHDPNILSNRRKPRSVHVKEKESWLQEWNKIQLTSVPVDLRANNPNPNSERLKERNHVKESRVWQKRVSRYFGFGHDSHGNIHRDVIESGIVRMLNGLPEGVDYPDRNKRIKAMGNAIVWQVAYEFCLWISEQIDDGASKV